MIKESSILVGIDPGKKGGIAIQFENRIEGYKMPETTKGLAFIFSKLSPDTKVYIESVRMIPSDIKTKGEADSAKIGKAMRMQALFQQFKQILTVLEMFDFNEESGNLIKVGASVWQKKLNIHVKNEDYLVRKKRLSNIAKEIFKGIKVINDTADAFLVLRYAAKVEGIQLINKSDIQLKILDI